MACSEWRGILYHKWGTLSRFSPLLKVTFHISRCQEKKKFRKWNGRCEFWLEYIVVGLDVAWTAALWNRMVWDVQPTVSKGLSPWKVRMKSLKSLKDWPQIINTTVSLSVTLVEYLPVEPLEHSLMKCKRHIWPCVWRVGVLTLDLSTHLMTEWTPSC